MNNYLIKSAALITVLGFATSGLAQPPSTGSSGAGGGLEINSEALARSIEEKLPDLYDKLGKAVSKKLDFLDLSYSNPDDEKDQSGWVAKYAWDYERVNKEAISDDGRLTTDDLFFKFEIDGTYAQHNTTNPGDMTTVSLSYQRRRADLGEIRQANEALAYRDCQLQVSRNIDLDNPPDAAGMQAIEDEAFKCLYDHQIDELIDSEDDYRVSVWDLHANIEANQDFTQRQQAYGFSGIYAMGRLPSIRVALDQVDAGNNDARKLLTDDLEFDRVSAELAYDTHLFSAGPHSVRFSASYRYFKELSAPKTIAVAGLDEFDYYSLSLRIPSSALPWFDSDDYNIFVRYVDGQLPFDLTPKQGIELGFSTNLKALGNLLAQ